MKSVKLLPLLIIFSLIGCCIEVDIAVPGFPEMARHFGVTEELIQRTLSVNFLGFCLASLIWGPLSEVFGRRKTLLFGQLLFALSGLFCALTDSIETLIICRFFQGFGASAMSTICIALVSDVYQGEKMVRFNGVLNALLTAAMAAAPIAGGFLTEAFGWRSNYTTVALVSGATFALLLAFLPETLRQKKPFELKTTLNSYTTLLFCPRFMRDALIPTLTVAGYLSFLGCGAFLYVDEMGLSPATYALCQGIVVACYSLTCFLAPRLKEPLLLGSAMLLLGVFFIGALYQKGLLEPITLTGAMSLYAIGCALLYTPIFSRSMEHHPDLKGYSSSFLMFFRMLFLALSMGAVGALYDGTLLAVAAATASLSFAALFLLQSSKYRILIKMIMPPTKV